ncbi:MAG: tetratricopeptide repeat protein, partial [Bacteroidota bacterium]
MFKLLFSVFSCLFFFLTPILCNDSLTLEIITHSEDLTNEDQYQEAIDLLQNHLLELDDSDSLDIASVKHKLGINYYYTDELDKAIECVSQAIQFRLAALGEEHIDTQNSLFLRLAIYRYQGKLEEALVDLERNIDYIQNNDLFNEAQKDSILTNRYDELGNIFLDLEDHHSAIFYWERVRAYQIANSGKNDLSVYQVEDQLATAYKNTGQYDKAILFFENAIQYYKQGQPLHKELCIAYQNLASTYQLQRKYKLANQYYKQAELSCQQANDKKNLLEVYVNQISNYTNTGELEQGVTAFQKGIALSQKITSQTFKADLYSNLGLLEATQNDYEGALSHYAEATQILVPNFEPTITNINPTPSQYNIQSKYDLLTVLSRKATVLMQKGERDNNIIMLRDALKTYEDINELITTIRLDYQIGKSKFLLL